MSPEKLLLFLALGILFGLSITGGICMTRVTPENCKEYCFSHDYEDGAVPK